MAKPATDSLRMHLDDLLSMKGAHLTFDEAVEDFPISARGVKPAGFPHSAWELLEHMRLAQADILDFSRNPEYRDKRFPDDYWPPSMKPGSEEAWETSVHQFQEDQASIRKLISDASHDLFAHIREGKDQTLLREALLVADHNAYHLGQLVFLRKMLQD